MGEEDESQKKYLKMFGIQISRMKLLLGGEDCDILNFQKGIISQ